MTWREVQGGYTKARRKNGGFIRNPRQYEKLRSLGMTKQRAAAITNSDSIGKSAFGIVIAKNVTLHDLAAETAGEYRHRSRVQHKSAQAASAGTGVAAVHLLHPPAHHGRGRAALATGGLAAATAGLEAASRRNRKQANTWQERANQMSPSESTRLAPLGKAFDSERQRHRRGAAYEGGAAGGSLVAGSSARTFYRGARRTKVRADEMAASSRMTHVGVRDQLHRLAQPGPERPTKEAVSHIARLSREGIDRGTEAQKLYSHARTGRQAAHGSAALAAGLAATAYGIHRHGANERKYGYR